MGTVMNQIDMQQAVSQAYTLAIKMYCAFTDGGWMDLEDIVSTKEIPGMESYTIDFSEYLLNDVSESTYEMRLRALEHSVEYTAAIARRGLRLNQGYTADATEKQFKLFQKSFLPNHDFATGANVFGTRTKNSTQDVEHHQSS